MSPLAIVLCVVCAAPFVLLIAFLAWIGWQCRAPLFKDKADRDAQMRDAYRRGGKP